MSATDDAIDKFTEAARVLIKGNEADKKHPFDDPRELRAWCLDRSIQMRGIFLRGKETEQAIAIAEQIRVFIVTGERPPAGWLPPGGEATDD